MVNSLRLLSITYLIRSIQVFKSAVAIFKGQISYYPKPVRAFEEKYAKSVGSTHAMMFSNATSAIEAALFSLGVGPSSKVGTTAFVIPSSYCSVKNLGAETKFYDISPGTLNIDEELVISASDKLSVLIVTHFYGNPCDMESIMNWANENDVFVIEDCSHAHGAAFKGRPLGSWGHVGVFSLQGAKAVAAGEGAIAVTDNSEFALKMVAYGHQESYKKFNIDSNESIKIPPFGFGRKMRVHPIGAVLAMVEFKYLNKKNKIFERWICELEELAVDSKKFHIPSQVNGAKRAGFCQGVPIVFYNKENADVFLDKAKFHGLSCFRRDYTESILYFSSVNTNDDNTVLDYLPHSISAFNTVVFVPFYQFIDPRRWSRLLSILG